MVVKHLRSTIFGAIDNEDLDTFFRDCVIAISKLDTLYNLLTDFEEDEVDDDDVLDALEGLVIKQNIIDLVSENQSSAFPIYNKYLWNTNVVLRMFINNVQMLVAKGLTPSIGDASLLKKEIKEIIGGLSFYVVEEFGVLIAYQALQDGLNVNDIPIDEIFNNYLKGNSLELEATCKELVAIKEEYRLHLDIFDEFPDLEAKFEEIVGPSYYLIPEGTLTLEVVQGVIDGTISVDSVIGQFDEEE